MQVDVLFYQYNKDENVTFFFVKTHFQGESEKLKPSIPKSGTILPSQNFSSNFQMKFCFG